MSFQAQWGMRGELDYNFEAVRIDGQNLEYNRFVWTLSASPSRLVPRVAISGNYGQQPDVSNVRVGTGGFVNANAVIRPTDHLALDLIGEQQWIDETVDGTAGQALHRVDRAREGDLRLQLADAVPDDRAVRADDARPGAVDDAGRREGGAVLRARRSSRTS